MPATVAVREVHAQEPQVRLVAYTAEPSALAVASARTCYAKNFVYVGRLTPKGERTRTDLESALPEHRETLQRIGAYDTPHERRIELVAAIEQVVADEDKRNALRAFADFARQRAEVDTKITQDIYEAGHHTPFQHPTFVFALEGVSRNVVESFLHQHIFYNSEQQSQRYVGMTDAEVVVPASIAGDPQARAVYEEAVRGAWDAYHQLRDGLVDANRRTMDAIARIKGESGKQALVGAQKKAQEMARYVIPIAATTKLYHTVSGIVLMRYLRMAGASSAPGEAQSVVAAMAEEVRRVDPVFFDRISEEPHPRDGLLEWQVTEDTPLAPAVDLEGHTSLLTAHTQGAPGIVARVVREVTGTWMEDSRLLARLMDPGQNHVWNDTLNTWDHSPALRALRHVHYTFHKRQSLTAYAQDQRHRLTPGTRPMLQRAVFGAPDVYTPDVIRGEHKALYDAAITALWDAMAKLRGMGVPAHDVAYLLPNATNIYYTQSGDLLAWIHKWRLRLCFNAQKEIFDAALDELRQVQAIHPELARWLGPPCSFIAATVPAEDQDSVEACCPEGPRWCGVKVWKSFDAAAGRPKRPY